MHAGRAPITALRQYAVYHLADTLILCMGHLVTQIVVMAHKGNMLQRTGQIQLAE